MVIVEFLLSILFMGFIVYGVIGGWRGFKQRQEEERGVADHRFFGQDEPFYWMTIGSWQHKDHANVNENTNDSYDYDGHIDF